MGVRSKTYISGEKTSGSGKKLSKSSNFGAITGTKAVCGSLGISSMKSHLQPLLPGDPMTPGRLAMTGKDTEKPKSKFA
jgi:hypothetical protein